MLINLSISGTAEEIQRLGKSGEVAKTIKDARIALPEDHIVVSINAVDSFVDDPAFRDAEEV